MRKQATQSGYPRPAWRKKTGMTTDELMGLMRDAGEWLADTNVLIDIINDDPQFTESSPVAGTLRPSGILVINPVIYGEVGQSAIRWKGWILCLRVSCSGRMT
ncbi:MAG: type II toxin-antitoxin system VapC family toxin [Thiolinea sp.]